MKAYLIIQSISLSDSAGSDTFILKRLLEEMGIECGIYALQMSVEAAYTGEIKSFDALPDITDDDIVIFVHKEGVLLCPELAELGGRKLLIYHEPVRPGALKREYCCTAYDDLRSQYLSTERMKSIFDGAVVFSEEGRKDLAAMGYECPVSIRPVMLSAEHYPHRAGGEAPEEMSGDSVNLVYCGRLIPDERIEDIIAAYACYRRYYNRKSRLLLVSDKMVSKKYCGKLKKYGELLSTEDIIIIESASSAAREAYIGYADVLVGGSGSGEFPEAAAAAVFMGIPVVMTDGGSARLLFPEGETLTESAEPHAAAAFIDRLLSDNSFMELVTRAQRQAAEEHCSRKAAELCRGQMKEFIEKSGELS